MPRWRNTALLGDAAFFAWLEANWRDLFAGGPAREHAIAVSCRAKAAIVARDERETGDRALLNLGHTFGHAFEAAAGFSDRLLHGEAIALGMALAFEFSARRGLIAAGGGRARHRASCGGRPADPCQRCSRRIGRTLDAMMELIAQDKKVKRGKLTFILVRGIGAAFVAPRCRCRRGARLPRREARRAMTIEDWLALAAILLCLLLSFFFAGSETALTASSRARHAAAREGRQPRGRASSTGCWRRASG